MDELWEAAKVCRAQRHEETCRDSERYRTIVGRVLGVSKPIV
jgi:hypothetical protein